MLKSTSENKGFTLIELMVVVAIIGVLAAIAIPNFLGMQEKARRNTILEVASSAKSELHHWMDVTIKQDNGVIDCNGDGQISSNEPACQSVANVPSSWINAFYAGSGTYYSPWYAGRGMFTTAVSPQSGQITLSMIISEQKIVIKGHDKNAVEIFFDAVIVD